MKQASPAAALADTAALLTAGETMMIRSQFGRGEREQRVDHHKERRERERRGGVAFLRAKIDQHLGTVEDKKTGHYLFMGAQVRTHGCTKIRKTREGCLGIKKNSFCKNTPLSLKVCFVQGGHSSRMLFGNQDCVPYIYLESREEGKKRKVHFPAPSTSPLSFQLLSYSPANLRPIL